MLGQVALGELFVEELAELPNEEVLDELLIGECFIDDRGWRGEVPELGAVEPLELLQCLLGSARSSR